MYKCTLDKHIYIVCSQYCLLQKWSIRSGWKEFIYKLNELLVTIIHSMVKCKVNGRKLNWKFLTHTHKSCQSTPHQWFSSASHCWANDSIYCLSTWIISVYNFLSSVFTVVVVVVVVIFLSTRTAPCCRWIVVRSTCL